MPLGRREMLQRSANNEAAMGSAPVERFLAELDFVEGLADLVGKKAAGWPKLMDQAFHIVSEAVESGSIDGLEKAVDQAEAILAPIGKLAKTYTIHCAGHGHIDMNWMWSWPETVAVTNDTFLTVLKLMDEFSDFCYTQSQASVYAIVQQYNPELFERIKCRVQEGRWEVAASHWVEGDKNIVSGEALARHLLYTRQFMKEHLGLNPEDVTIDWSPDTFGHALTIPLIDARGGVKHYYMCRGGTGEKPPVFWYKAPDGSKILVNLETTWYNDHIAPHNALAMLKFCKKTGLKDWLNVYGVGDHGGGPTRRDILRCYEMDGWPIYPTFQFGTTREYYKILEQHGDKWPVIDRELNFEFTGCYTTQTQIKRNNRLGENYLVEAEIAASLATLILGWKYPAGTLRDRWVDVLFSHFHDILPGSGVAETRQYNQGQFQNVAAATQMIKTNSLRALAGAVDTSFAGPADTDEIVAAGSSLAIGGGAGRGTHWGGLSNAGHVVDGPRPVVVFNPTAWVRNEVVQATVWDADTGPAGTELKQKTFVVRTAEGKVVPTQKIGEGGYWGHRFVDLAFPVEVGSLGYNTYAIEEGTVQDFEAPVKCLEEPGPGQVSFAPSLPTLENEFLAVEFDSLTGGVSRLVDKKTGRNLADAANPLGVLEYVLERPGGMSAWVIAPTQERQYPLQVHSLKRTQSGPFQAVVEAKLNVQNSSATVTYTLEAGQPWLEIAVQTRWVEIGTGEKGCPSLLMRFPLALTEAKGLYEIPFGAIQRDLNRGQEVPALRWLDVSGKQGTGRTGATAGCAVANDSKYGYSLDGSVLRATLIRSSYEPDPIPEVGDHIIRFALMPHAARPATADLVRLGASFNHPLQVVATDVHKGTLAVADEAMPSVRPDSVVVTSLKRAEAGDGFVVRLQETAGKAVTATVALSAGLLGKIQDVVEVDLLERPVGKSSAAKVAGGFSVKVPGFGIASVKVTFPQ